MVFDKDDSAGYLANHMARLFAAALTRRIAPLGLMPGQFMVLLELWREDGLTQRDLVERLDVEQATMANTLNRMERDGLIMREPDAADRRARRVRLTARARALEAPATEAATEVNARALARLSPGDRARFPEMLQAVIAALRADR
ncbi:MarR family transcriptional regulator [Rhodovulum sp. BSW8]|uniref:MarR family transcriptional regulator n=1 Tax=Rhodovulum visakhapatnamense TaxID=364297 RepID=A0A4V3GUL6_9RHOB|nr:MULTISPECIES: MarR family transcriptional regulator [Rhodovulum]OLS43990.1 MarR family transcriptional regulator [Rhodovulum sulfidophilum]MBL3570750.1 MarR family transcriptional regulator [Rhodovulum visakhapatnamense]MBL3576889.1 MarR family transcriptional regulator [Rhodovulum visakhapatnamense]RBO51411.1 MarR family transcriptional regulator [Rhodovulum sp. BSW8]TDX31320.1 DNA-binding MarR family transcriptional regulator [Rhodovulum visakhapatnamense]